MTDNPKTTGTPGPWRINTENGLRVLACDPRDTIVAKVTGALSNPSSFVDARLIAAAPDLLAACKLAVAAMGDMDAARYIQRFIDMAEGRAQ